MLKPAIAATGLLEETRHRLVGPHLLTLGLRWIVEATNNWWADYGQLRRSTDRNDRHAALQLATTVLIISRLIDHLDRWSPR